MSLALQMISDGITIDAIALLRIKENLVRLLGFQDVKMLSSTTGTSFTVRFNDLANIPSYTESCLNDLMLVLDCPQSCNIPPHAISDLCSEDDAPVPILTGSIFVDVLVEIFIQADDLTSLPFINVKNLLKSFTIVLYKHDLDSKPLRHIHGGLRKAARRILDIALAEISYELRQLAMSVAQVFIKRWPHIVGNFIWYAVLQ